MATVFQRIGGPTIKCGNRFGSIQVIGQVLAHPGDHIGGVWAGRRRGRAAPALQPGEGLLEDLLAPIAVPAVVPGQQTQPDGRRFDARARSCDTSTRLPRLFDILCPSQPIIPACT